MPNTRSTILAGAIAAAIVLPTIVAAPVADAASSAPRLLHGPQVYRLNPTGAKFGDVGEISYRYAVVFMLSRVVIGPTFEGDDEGDVKAGDFTLSGVYLPEYTHDLLYSKRFRPQRCAVAYFEQNGPNPAKDRRKLDRIRLGQKVSITLRPLASANPDVSYGPTYHRTAVMRRASTYTLTDAGAQRQLRAIDCQRRG